MLEDLSRHTLQNRIPLHYNILLQMLVYKWKNEVGNLREFGPNLTSNAVCSIGSCVLKKQEFQNEIWTNK
jgi:hypothetical protein